MDDSERSGNVIKFQWERLSFDPFFSTRFLAIAGSIVHWMYIASKIVLEVLASYPKSTVLCLPKLKNWVERDHPITEFLLILGFSQNLSVNFYIKFTKIDRFINHQDCQFDAKSIKHQDWINLSLTTA